LTTSHDFVYITSPLSYYTRPHLQPNGVLGLLNQRWLVAVLVGEIVVTGTGVSLSVGDGVVLDVTLSAGQCGVSTGVGGVVVNVGVCT
jgi:hypothetical protein